MEGDAAEEARSSLPRSINDRLHEERVGPGRSKRTFRANTDELPDGVFVTLDKDVDRAYLLWEGRLLAWTPVGSAFRSLILNETST